MAGKYESKKKIRFLAPTLVIINHPRLPLVRETASLSISPFLALAYSPSQRERKKMKNVSDFFLSNVMMIRGQKVFI